jgi:hypothetical protein
MNRPCVPAAAAALLFCCFCASSVTQATESLIIDGGFEAVSDAAAQELPKGWEPHVVGAPAKVTSDTSQTHSGQASARIDANEISRAYVRSTTPIEVAPGETIEASAWVKVRGVPADKGTVIMIAEFADATGQHLGVEKINTLNVKSAGDAWKQLRGSVKVPQDAARLHLRLGFSYSKGTVWWDDVAVTAKQPLALRIDLPQGRLSPAMKKLPLTLLNRSGATKPLIINIAVNKQSASAKYTPSGDAVQRLGISINPPKPGDAVVQASLLEAKGQPPVFVDEAKATVPPPLTLGIPSPTHWIVDDGQPLIEGLIDVAVPDEVREGATLSVRVIDSAGTLRGQWQPGGGGPQEGRREFTLKTALLPEGDYKIVATLTPMTGAPIKAEQPWQIISGVRTRVALNPRGYPEFDGKPIFPLGIFNGGKFKEQADAGFTVTHAYNAVRIENDDLIAADHRALSYLNRTHEHGMKALCMVPMKLVIAGDWHGVRRRVRMFRNHPGLLAWDEEEGFARGDFKADTLKNLRQILREEDPNHPFMVGDSYDVITRIPSDRATFFPLGEMDMGMWWWYPFPLKQRQGDALLGEDEGSGNGLEAAPPTFLVNARTRKPLWVGVQAYKKGGEGNRYPTPAEYRAQAYIALAHGAKGLMWYGGSVTGGAFHDLEASHWPELKQVVREMRDNADFFTMGANDTPPALEPSDAPVSIIARKLGRKKLLVAVNRTAHPAEVTLGGEALPLEPFGVHVVKE